MQQFEISDNLNEHLLGLEWNDKLAIVSSHMDIQYDKYLPSLVFCFNHPNIIHTYSLKMLMHKRFPLAKELDKFIQRSFEVGLMAKWLGGNAHEIPLEKPPKFQFIQIVLETISFTVVLSMALILFSISVLLIEIIIDKRVRAIDSNKLWRYIEMMIDPHRYFLLDNLNYN